MPKIKMKHAMNFLIIVGIAFLCYLVIFSVQQTEKTQEIFDENIKPPDIHIKNETEPIDIEAEAAIIGWNTNQTVCMEFGNIEDFKGYFNPDRCISIWIGDQHKEFSADEFLSALGFEIEE